MAEPGRIAPATLVAFAGVMYGALAIAVTGFVSLLTDSDVIAVHGLGPVPGALAVLFSVLLFTATLWPVLGQPRPAYPRTVPVAFAAAAGHLLALWLFALLFGARLGAATAAVGGAIVSWTSPVFFLVAAATAWGAIAVRRTAARPPMWPWERRSDDGE